VAGSRQVAELQRHAGAEGKHIQHLVAGPQRVRLRVRRVGDGVAGPDLADLAVLPQQPRPRQHVEDLLLGAVDVSRRGAAPWLDRDPVQADPVAATRAKVAAVHGEAQAEDANVRQLKARVDALESDTHAASRQLDDRDRKIAELERELDAQRKP